MNPYARREALRNLVGRDKRIFELAWKIRNDLILSQQNQGRSAEEKYSKSSDDALEELENILIQQIP